MAYSKQSKYHVILQDLKAAILCGELAVGTLLPSENQLGAQYETSRTTVRKALALLVEEGLVSTAQGKGYFINKPQPTLYQTHLNREDIPFSIKLLGVSIQKTTPNLVQQLNIPLCSKVLNTKRLFYAKGKIVGYGCKYSHYVSHMPILEEDFQYSSFEEHFFKNTKKNVTCHPMGATTDLASILQVAEGEPLWFLAQTHLDESGTVLSFEELYMIGNKYKIQGD